MSLTFGDGTITLQLQYEDGDFVVTAQWPGLRGAVNKAACLKWAEWRRGTRGMSASSRALHQQVHRAWLASRGLVSPRGVPPE